MKIKLWGTRGSLASPGADTARYGGNTSTVAVEGREGTMIVLDAGTGIRLLGASIKPNVKRVDILLTHLHMDHIQGLGFFGPLYNPNMEVHVWGPPSCTWDLRTRLTRYLSPPLFPVHLRDLPCKLFLHNTAHEVFDIQEFKVTSSLVCHPGPTVGFRLACSEGEIAYLPDHEPVLGGNELFDDRHWLSGMTLAEGADLLIHDAQYTPDEYRIRVGWGHSSLPHAFDFAQKAGIKHFVPFHHDPSHNDQKLDELFQSAIREVDPGFAVTPGIEGACFDVIKREVSANGNANLGVCHRPAAYAEKA